MSRYALAFAACCIAAWFVFLMNNSPKGDMREVAPSGLLDSHRFDSTPASEGAIDSALSLPSESVGSADEPGLLQSYFDARLQEPRDDEHLKKLLEQIAWASSTEEAWNDLLEAVSDHSDSTDDQLLTAHATRLTLEMMRVDQRIVDLSFERFAQELEPRAVHVLSQSLKMARAEGLFGEPISLEYYSAYCNSEDWLARQLLVNTVHATGEQEWTTRLLSDALRAPLETYHPVPSKWRVTAAIGVQKLFKYERSRREQGAPEVDSRPLLRDDIVEAACDATVSASEWVALYRVAREYVPDAATEILEGTKSSQPDVLRFRDYYRSIGDAMKELQPSGPGD